MEHKKTRFIKKWDIIVLIVLLLFCLIWFGVIYFMRTGNGKVYAEITVDGKVYERIDLEKSENKTFKINDNVAFQIENHKIRFIDVNCPDKICEQYGYIFRPNEVAICMPNKTTIRIVAKNKDEKLDLIVE